MCGDKHICALLVGMLICTSLHYPNSFGQRYVIIHIFYFKKVMQGLPFLTGCIWSFLVGWEQTKHIKQWFSRHWTSGSEGEWLLGDKKQIMWPLGLTPNYCWEKGSKPWCKEGELRQNLPVSLSWGDRAEEGKVARVHQTEHWTGESHTQRAPEMCWRQLWI